MKRVLVMVLLATPMAAAGARAQTDAGPVVDAGPGVCDPRCTGDVLSYCDGETPVELNCRDINARCGLLSAAWGEDCLLGAGDACDPGYAFGASRCDPVAGLFCIDGACENSTGPVDEPVEEPTAGTEIGLDTGTANPFGCPDCGSGQAALLVPALFVLRGLRRRR